jgi:hypothetical protein
LINFRRRPSGIHTFFRRIGSSIKIINLKLRIFDILRIRRLIFRLPLIIFFILMTFRILPSRFKSWKHWIIIALIIRIKVLCLLSHIVLRFIRIGSIIVRIIVMNFERIFCFSDWNKLLILVIFIWRLNNLLFRLYFLLNLCRMIIFYHIWLRRFRLNNIWLEFRFADKQFWILFYLWWLLNEASTSFRWRYTDRTIRNFTFYLIKLFLWYNLFKRLYIFCRWFNILI